MKHQNFLEKKAFINSQKLTNTQNLLTYKKQGRVIYNLMVTLLANLSLLAYFRKLYIIRA